MRRHVMRGSSARLEIRDVPCKRRKTYCEGASDRAGRRHGEAVQADGGLEVSNAGQTPLRPSRRAPRPSRQRMMRAPYYRVMPTDWNCRGQTDPAIRCPRMSAAVNT